MRRVPRYLVVGFLVAMVGFTAAGFLTIRRDVGNLRVLGQENALWNASQLETELLRFRLSLEAFQRHQTRAAAEEVRERFEPDVGEIAVTGFAAEAPPGWEPTLDDEHVGYRWCSEAEAIALLRYPEPQDAVRRTARSLAGARR